MKPKTLIPLAVIVVVLGALAAMRSGQDKPLSITDEVKLTALLPEGLSAEAVSKLELYAGGAPDEKLLFYKDAGTWKVASHYDGPVTETKITEYLESLTKLKGEFRATVPSDEGLADYELDDATGFHIIGYEGGDTPAFHVLVGKSPNYGNVFMRAEDSKDVFLADFDPRQKAGVYSDDRSAVPEANTWLDKNILQIDNEKITRIALSMPDKELVLEKVAKEPPVSEEEEEEEEEDTEAESDEGDADDTQEDPPPPAPVEYEWKVTSAGFPGSSRDTAFEPLLRKIANLRASDIVDPGKTKAWGLEPNTYSATISVEGQDEEIVIEGGRTRNTGEGYVRLASKDENLIYKLSKYDFEQLFPRGSSFFDLPKLFLKGADVNRIEADGPAGKVVVSREDGEWTVEEPKADQPLLDTVLTTLANTLATWKAEDYADARDGFDAPTRNVRFTTTGGATHTLFLGGVSPHFDGNYAWLDDDEQVLVVTRGDLEKIFLEPKDLYDRALFDVDEESITAIDVTKAGTSYRLARNDDGWSLTVDGVIVPADTDKADQLAYDIADLEAVDLAFDSARTKGDALGSIRFETDDSENFSFEIEEAEGTLNPVTVQGLNTPYLIVNAAIEDVLLDADTFRLPVEESQEEGSEESAEGDEASEAEETSLQ